MRILFDGAAITLALSFIVTGCGPSHRAWPMVLTDHLEVPASTVPTPTSTETLPALDDGIIQFSGYTWTVRHSGLSGPGPNLWSHENVWLDEAGDLHLKISHDENGWQ